MPDSAVALHELGPAVVPTGGTPDGGLCRDVLVDERGVHRLDHPSVASENDHGTGCTCGRPDRGSGRRSACR
ncbi:bifunctional hydroxymethylpyrimidine kinase/phosphomethylpyrimidine kinase [Nocardioides sp. InS609-2]|uniref:bifunctional hydroxymethylpyrimidine kinase/phosphomethylpyrimidine kinase n=1 Tax=Nocardioides sp. InS609-2 TaxID=2760705 RepID=UPI0020C01B5A|nr:bifunctional hydroxymethylpyrimidine kinase/phosphomethylpyrimidine kinase [Nocardioides sp. InS609-2]